MPQHLLLMIAWRHSFVTRWAALFAGLIIAVVLVSGWLRDRASRAYFLQDQRRHLSQRVELIRDRVQSAVDGVCKDVLYLSRAPAFARLASANNENDRAAALGEAALHMKGGLEVRPSYFQARLIGLADGGLELIRFDQTNGAIRVARADELRREGDQNYFKQTACLGPGNSYLSDICLERESGHLTEPQRAALQVSAPVFDNGGKSFGVVTVSVDVEPLFDELKALAGPEVVVCLCNSQGDYLFHPCLGKCFGFDLGQRFTLYDDYPYLRQGGLQQRFEDDESQLAITDEFAFSRGSDKLLILRLELPKAPLLEPLKAQRASNLFATLGLALVAGAVVFGVTNLFARSLRRVTEAVERYEPGKPLPELPPETSDEIGLLTGKFRDMAGKITEQMQGLREARQRAEAAVHAREEFLATISHEIRTPMNAVLGMTYLLETEGSGDHLGERLRTLKFAGRHLMALLNNLLDRERIESGDIILDSIDFDLAELLENVHGSLEPLASRKVLGFSLEMSPALPRRVRGDPVRLYQVLNNLVHNSIKFTEMGQVVVAVSSNGDGQVNFRIGDSGPGLPGHVLDEIARKRSDSTSEKAPRRGDGSSSITQTETGGLGLRISTRLIELLGGRLEATSSSAGTILAFSLPLPAAAGTAMDRTAEEPPDLKGYSALVVEDVLSNQTVLAAFLNKTGMSADFAQTASGGLEKLQSGDYDFGFVDIQLPDGNGADLAARLLKIQPDLRLLAVTAQVTPAVRATCESAGVRGFVPKPIEPAELYDKLRRLTSPRIEAVCDMFDHDAAKISDYLSQLDHELKNWQDELHDLIRTPDSEKFRRLHHRMRNVIGQLDLWKLNRTLEAMAKTMANGHAGNLEAAGSIALRVVASARENLKVGTSVN